jgi:hypothetical protein
MATIEATLMTRAMAVTKERTTQAYLVDADVDLTASGGRMPPVRNRYQRPVAR